MINTYYDMVKCNNNKLKQNLLSKVILVKL